MRSSEIYTTPKVVREVSDYHCDEIMRFCFDLADISKDFVPREHDFLEIKLLRAKEIDSSYKLATKDSKLKGISNQDFSKILTNEMFTLESFSKSLLSEIHQINFIRRRSTFIPVISLSNKNLINERLHAIEFLNGMSGNIFRAGTLAIHLGYLNNNVTDPVKFLKESRSLLHTGNYNIENIELGYGEIKLSKRVPIDREDIEFGF